MCHGQSNCRVEDRLLVRQPSEQSHVRGEQRRESQKPEFGTFLQVQGGRSDAQASVVVAVLKRVYGVVEERPVDARGVESNGRQKGEQTLRLRAYRAVHCTPAHQHRPVERNAEHCLWPVSEAFKPSVKSQLEITKEKKATIIYVLQPDKAQLVASSKRPELV